MRKKTSKEFGCILTHEQEEFINDGRPRDNALKIFRAKARREGMAYALRFARKKGLDALEADLKMRNAIDLPLRVSKADLDKFSDNVKYNTVLYVKILMAVTMHDEFGFGNKRIKQMFERFDNKAECIAEDYSTWEEQISIIAEECGIDMETERRDLRTVIK